MNKQDHSIDNVSPDGGITGSPSIYTPNPNEQHTVNSGNNDIGITGSTGSIGDDINLIKHHDNNGNWEDNLEYTQEIYKVFKLTAMSRRKRKGIGDKLTNKEKAALHGMAEQLAKMITGSPSFNNHQKGLQTLLSRYGSMRNRVESRFSDRGYSLNRSVSGGESDNDIRSRIPIHHTNSDGDGDIEGIMGDEAMMDRVDRVNQDDPFNDKITF